MQRVYGARLNNTTSRLLSGAAAGVPGLPAPAPSVDQRSKYPLVRYQSGDKCVGEGLQSCHWLATHGGIGAIFTIAVDAGYEALNSTNPVWTAPLGASLGNHCQCVVGYGTFGGQVCFIVRNSWGTGFGDGGYAFIPVARFAMVATNIVAMLSAPSLGADVWASELGIWTVARARERDRSTDPIPNVGCMPVDAIDGTIAVGIYARDARDDNAANDTGPITLAEDEQAYGHRMTPDNYLPIADADTTTLQQVLTMGAQQEAA